MNNKQSDIFPFNISGHIGEPFFKSNGVIFSPSYEQNDGYSIEMSLDQFKLLVDGIQTIIKLKEQIKPDIPSLKKTVYVKQYIETYNTFMGDIYTLYNVNATLMTKYFNNFGIKLDTIEFIPINIDKDNVTYDDVKELERTIKTTVNDIFPKINILLYGTHDLAKSFTI